MILYIQHPLTCLLVEGFSHPGARFQITRLELACSPGAEQIDDRGLADKVRRDFVSSLDGTPTILDEYGFVLDQESDFARKVLLMTSTIPWGTTWSYRELAIASSSPNGMRAVAQVLRYNRFPLLIPCHRVIRADGTIGGFSGERSGHVVDIKRKLLAREGVLFTQEHIREKKLHS